MADGFIFDTETAYAMGLLYSGETATYILCNSSAWGKAAAIADVIATELFEQDGYERVSQVIGSGTWEPSNRRTTAVVPDGSFVADGGDFTWDAAVLLLGADSQANRLITAVNVATNTFTTSGNHLLADDDRVIITTDDPGVNPGGVLSTVLHYAVVIDSDEFQLSTTAGGGAIVNVTDAGDIGVHPTRLRYANGRIVGAYKRPTAQTVFDGQTIPIPFTLAAMNAGFGSGV